MTDTQPDHPTAPTTTAPATPATQRALSWWPAIVIGLVAFVDRVEINLIAGALPAIQDHFGIGDTLAGAIPTAASIAAALLLLPAGRLADRAPRVATVAIVVLVWSLCSVLSGLATGFAMFFLVRIAIGAAGQLYNPPASSLLADYYPATSRGKAFGFERAGYYMGLPAGVVIGGAVAEALDWRAVFFIAAIPGLVVAALVMTLKEPRREHNPAELPKGALLAEARELLKVRTLRGVVACQAMLSLGVAGLFYWLPTFLERTEDLGYDAASGLAGGVGGTGIVIGIIGGSRIGDQARTPSWRIAVAGAFLLVGAVGLTLAVVLPGLPLRISLIAVACAGFAGAIPNLTAAAAEVVPAASRGMGFAVLQFLTTLGGAFGPLLIGVSSDLIGSLQVAMLILLPPLFACVVILRGVRHTFAADSAAAAA